MIYSNIKVIAQRINPYQYARCYLFSREGGWWEGGWWEGCGVSYSKFQLLSVEIYTCVYCIYLYI